MILPLYVLLLSSAEPQPVRCPVPAVQLAGRDAAFAMRFKPGTEARGAAEANVRAAFRSACAKGLLRGDRIPKLSGASSPRVFLENWPDANVASIEADQLGGEGGWRLILGYSFVASDGSVNVPKPAEIEEAIYCAVRGATEREQAESGRCVLD